MGRGMRSGAARQRDMQRSHHAASGDELSAGGVEQRVRHDALLAARSMHAMLPLSHLSQLVI